MREIGPVEFSGRAAVLVKSTASVLPLCVSMMMLVMLMTTLPLLMLMLAFLLSLGMIWMTH